MGDPSCYFHRLPVTVKDVTNVLKVPREKQRDHKKVSLPYDTMRVIVCAGLRKDLSTLRVNEISERPTNAASSSSDDEMRNYTLGTSASKNEFEIHKIMPI